MTPAHVIFHRLAAAEFREAHGWYAARSDDAAKSFKEEVDRTLRRIASQPESGTPYGRRFRWIKVHRFAYVLFYELIADGRLRILAVAHGRRRPGYWLWRSSKP